MTQTEFLMESINRHNEHAQRLSRIGAEMRESGDGHGYSKVRGALATVFAEREIKRDLLARMCAPWFEGKQ